MASQQVRTAIGQLYRLIGRGAASAPSDAMLLEDFVLRRDEKAFEVLVWRHAAMVFGVCGRVLRDSHAADDAFQATFLVFARKAGSIGQRESIASWLYTVANRVAMRARARAVRYIPSEPLGEVPDRQTTDDLAWTDLKPVLDEEIGRLPEKYRIPFVLCYLEGQTNEEAAEQIGCPKGTVLSRLARGRERLRSRLTRRGIALSAALLATTLIANAASAAAPPALVSSTVQAAIPFAAGSAAAGLVSAPVASLTNGALQAMIATKVKLAVALLAIAIVSTGAGVLAQATSLTEETTTGAAPTPAPMNEPQTVPAAIDGDLFAFAAEPQDERRPVRELRASDHVGLVVAVGKDGKSFTAECAAQERGAAPVKIEVKINDKTSINYNSVGVNGAKPTEGYGVTMWLDTTDKTLATQLMFTGPEGANRGGDLTGTISAIEKDGKGITLEIPAGRGAERGAEPKRVTVRFDDKTVLVFSNVTAGEDKLVEGQRVVVWYDDNARVAGNRIAGKVQLYGNANTNRDRRTRGPDITGRLVSGNDTSLTIEKFVGRVDEPTKVTVKLSPKSSVVYHNVGIGGAKPTAGQQVQVWFDGAQDTANEVMLTGTVPERWTTVSGKVVAISADGNTITLEQPATVRGEEPKRTEIKLTAQTRLAFSNVGPDGAKPKEGYTAQVRLLDVSKDTAAQVLFSTAPIDRGR